MNQHLGFPSWAPLRRLRHLAIPALIGLLGSAQGAVAQMPAAPAADGAKEEMEVPHPFFTHEGLPDAVGTFSLRTAALLLRTDGSNTGDFAFHFETGLSKTIGLHIRNDRFLNSAMTEIMFQFVAILSKDGKSGFAPLIEFEFPTNADAERRINTLVGQTAKLANSRVAFNEVLHYNPAEKSVDWSASFVVVTKPWLYPVVEVLGAGGSDAKPAVNLLAGIKVRIREGILLGLAYSWPVTSNRDFSSELALQPDFEWSAK